jgi:rhamnosyltransferase
VSEVVKPRVSIAMRSYNDIDVIRGTLEQVRSQNYQAFVLHNFDSTSRDGTLDIIAEFNDESRIHLNDSSAYNSGTVLNEAVEATAGEIIVFLNSDATPEHDDWLEQLIAPFDDPAVGATFGRQTPRLDCRALFAKDTERAFGDGSVSANWVHFFSMANSAVRRPIALEHRFETRVQYSEDIEWSLRLKKAGIGIEYVAEAAAMHSHNYTLKESYKRMFGEGVAEAYIFRDGEMSMNFLRYVVAPFGIEVLRDFAWGVKHASPDAITHSVPLRFAQKWGRWKGLAEGQRKYGRA